MFDLDNYYLKDKFNKTLPNHNFNTFKSQDLKLRNIGDMEEIYMALKNFTWTLMSFLNEINFEAFIIFSILWSPNKNN